MIIDLHQDISVSLLNKGVEYFMNPNTTSMSEDGIYSKYGIVEQLSLPVLNTSDYKIIVGASCSLSISKSGIIVPENPYSELLKHIAIIKKLISKSKNNIQLINCGRAIRAIDSIQNSKLGIILSIEGIYFIKNNSDFDLLHNVFKAGIKIIAPFWSIDNKLGGGANSRLGLTNLGKDFICHLNDNGIIIDGSHTNTNSLNDILEITQKPIIVSHTLSRTIFDHPRNLCDKDIRRVSKNGGLIGVCFIQNYNGSSQLSSLVKHMKHIIQVGGSDCIAIGSDFGGMTKENLIQHLEGPEKTSNLIDALNMAKINDTLIEKLLWKNAKRYLSENLN